MKIAVYSGLIVLLFLSLFGCRKKNTAGLGGDNELRITVRHHTIVLDSITVFIKFNAYDAPVDSLDYDLKTRVKVSDNDTVAIFSGLKDGQYYLFGQGWDPYIVKNVKGGLPIELDNEKQQPVEVFLQVTEDGH